MDFLRERCINRRREFVCLNRKHIISVKAVTPSPCAGLPPVDVSHTHTRYTRYTHTHTRV